MLPRRAAGHKLPVHIGQPEVAALEAVSQLGVIESQQVQDGSVQVVHVHGILDRVEAKLVAFANRNARLDAAAGKPMVKALG